MPRGNPMGYLNQGGAGGVPNAGPGQPQMLGMPGAGSGRSFGMQSAPGGPNPSPPGGPPPGGGFGSRGSAPGIGFAGQQAIQMRGGGLGSGAEKYQSEIDRIQRELMMAQINGGDPRVIASLQMELQGAQRAMRQAGQAAMASAAKEQPRYLGAGSVGTGGRGGRPSQQYQQWLQNQQVDMQLLASLWGLGSGPGYGQGNF